MNGIVNGGWDYVWMAFGVTAGALGLYVASTVSRLRQEEKDRARAAKEMR